MRSKKFTALFLIVAIGVAVWAGCQTSKSTEPPVQAQLPTSRLKPGPNDPNIAYVTARLLESYQYLQHPFDTEMSAKAFDGYIDALDPRHENFLQSDLDEFAGIRTNLDLLIVGNGKKAELEPVFSIFERFVERDVQHTAYVNEVLEHEKLKFTTDDKINLDRRHEPFPKDLSEAEQLWKQRLTFEYLTEKLLKETHETNGTYTIRLPADAATNIVASLEKNYHDNLKYMTNWGSDDVLAAFLDYGLAHAYDPHSDYFSPPKAADFGIEMNLALIGIGAQLQDKDGFCTIMDLIPGGPAMKSKQLRPDDRIIAVAQGDKPPVDVVNMELDKIVQMIRGTKNTEVRLTISPQENRSAHRVISLIREEIKLEDKEAKAELLEYPDGKRIGVIDLPSFYAPVTDSHTTPKYTSVDVAILLNRLKKEKVQGIILDLRANPGGSLEEAVKFTGLFIKGGPVVLARDALGHVTEDEVPEPNQVYDGPLVVMLNRYSASASEIAAAALQDYGRAVIVGDVSTHGKGTVQQLKELRPFIWPADADATNDPGTLKVTMGKFYRISGSTTQMKGVASDIVLPDILNHSTMIGEGALENALGADTIQPVHYDKFNLVAPYLAELQRRSLDRVATNQEFVYIRQDIEQFKKNQADRTASLNEHELITEREEDGIRGLEREKERASRPLPTVKTYDLTLENASNPGLPAPKPFFTTNYYTNDFVVFNAKTAAGQAHQFVGADSSAYVFTNNFSPELQANFAGYFRTNFAAIPADRITYTSSPTTNIIAEIGSSLSPTNMVVKPLVVKTVSDDPTLEESANIMRDYISLLPKSGMFSATE